MRGNGLFSGVLAAAVTAGLAGCQTIGPASVPLLASGGLVYEGGTATQAFAYNQAQVTNALIEAMADLGIHQVRQTNTVDHLSFDGKTVDGRRANVNLDSRVTPPVVTARFGWLGDEALSRAFMDRVGIRLGSLPPSAIPAEPPTSPARPPIMMGPERTVPGSRPLSDAGYHDSPIP
jgi:hypothetical protein